MIDGQAEIVGSRTGQIDRAIARAAARKGKIAVRLVRGADGKVRAMLPARAAGAKPEPATVWMVLIDRSHTTKIKRGENGGKRLTYTHVVRTLRRVGAWRGEKTALELPVTETIPGRRDACVVRRLLQLFGKAFANRRAEGVDWRIVESDDADRPVFRVVDEFRHATATVDRFMATLIDASSGLRRARVRPSSRRWSGVPTLAGHLGCVGYPAFVPTSAAALSPIAK